MSIKITVLILTGITGIAVVAGTLQALDSPRKGVKKEGDQEDDAARGQKHGK